MRAPVKKRGGSGHRALPWRTDFENPRDRRCCRKGGHTLPEPGQRADITEAEPPLDEVNPKAFIADKAYDADALIEKLKERQITPVISSRKNHRNPRKISFQFYKSRTIIERFFARLKQFRGIATRYDKPKSTFLAAVQLVSAIIGIN